VGQTGIACRLEVGSRLVMNEPEHAAANPLRSEHAAVPRIAIIGGGLAGLAAAVALANRNLNVTLLEARRQLGGRAGSFRDPASDAWVDHCQHVSLGCCTNLADFCRRTGLSDLLRRDQTLHFFGPDGCRCDVAAAGWLPAPLHLLPSLLRLKYLSLGERLGIISALQKLAHTSPIDDPYSPTIGQWLRDHGQSERAIELFWTPIIVSALSETVDRAAVPPVRKVFVDAFLAARSAYELQIPRVPLGEFYGQRLEQWLAQNHIALRLECPIKHICGEPENMKELELADGQRLAVDFVILAVPWRRIGELLSDTLRAALPELNRLDQLESAPITAVHLWFDRPITHLPHAVLPGRTSQWVFNHGPQHLLNGSTSTNESPSPLAGEGGARGSSTSDNGPAISHYYQVVISASRELETQPREQIIAQVQQELAAVWPDAAQAKLLQARLITQQHAVFSPLPGSEQLRPGQKTAVPNLFLAGDWTATGWPATMEGAVRSGYLAAEGLLARLGQPISILVPDLPRPWLAKLITR
jgi:squalene-associated FAD-dependent desaturase